MHYAIALRAIGQSLEMLRLQTFSLETKGQVYIVRSDSLTATHEWILRNSLTDNVSDVTENTESTVSDGSLRYGPREIAQLNAQTEKKSRQQQGREHTLPGLLHALGELLDMKEASALDISWTPQAALVNIVRRMEFVNAKISRLRNCTNLPCVRNSEGPTVGPPQKSGGNFSTQSTLQLARKTASQCFRKPGSSLVSVAGFA